MRARALAVVLVAGLLGAPACGRGGGDEDGYRLELDGRAQVTVNGKDRKVEAGTHTLHAGDTIRMLDGRAVLGLPGDRALWLRSRDGDASIVEVASTPDVVDGDVVAVGTDAMHVTAGEVDVRFEGGAVRFHRGIGVTVGMYRGDAEVRAAGRALRGGLPALRQVSIAATGQLPREPVPLVYDDRDPDPWDRRFIGDAIDLGGFLDTESRGFTSQIGPRATVDATLLQRVLPPLAAQGWLATKLGTVERSAGEALVGAAIVVESGGRLEQQWDDVFSFREAGARWGLVALDQQVKRDALKDRLVDALGRSPLLFAAGPRPGGGGGAAPTVTSPPGPGGGDNGDGGGDAGDGGPTTTTPPPEGPVPTMPPATTPPITIPPIVPELDPPGESPGRSDGVSPPGLDGVGPPVADIVDLVSPSSARSPLP